MTPRLFRHLALATAVAAYLQAVLGGTVKAFGAGLSCPDWPLCQGKLIPPFDPLVLLEYTHRLGALGVVALSLAAAFVGWRVYRRGPVVWTSLAALVLLAVLVVLGGMTVLYQLPPAIVGAHLGVAMLMFGTWIALGILAPDRGRAGRVYDGLGPARWLLPLGAALSVWLVMLLGSYMKSIGGGVACPDVPLCDNAFADPLAFIHLTHRVAALLAGGVILTAGAFALRHLRHHRSMLTLSALSIGLYLLQVGLGVAAVLLVLPPPITVAHLATASALFGTLVAMAATGYRANAQANRTAAELSFSAGATKSAAISAMAAEPNDLEAPTAAPGLRNAGWRQVASDFLELTKPRVMVLLLITGFAAMVVAARGLPDLRLSLLTMLGLAMSTGGAGAVNMWYDRDIDAMMSRTRHRPIPAGRVQPAHALWFGIILQLASFLLLGFSVNWLAAALSLGGFLFYVFIYTLWLKRSTPQNIVIGGAAGAFPPLIGWAAVTGELSLAAWLMFLIVFLWTPPHFWALALFKSDDYRRAGVPMMPVSRGELTTKWQSLWYAALLVPVSALLYWTGAVGVAYLWLSVLLGMAFVLYCVALLRERMPEVRWAKRTFGYSLLYLAVLFAVMVLDLRGF